MNIRQEFSNAIKEEKNKIDVDQEYINERNDIVRQELKHLKNKFQDLQDTGLIIELSSRTRPKADDYVFLKMYSPMNNKFIEITMDFTESSNLGYYIGENTTYLKDLLFTLSEREAVNWIAKILYKNKMISEEFFKNV